MSLTYPTTKSFNQYFYGFDNYNSRGIYSTTIPNYTTIYYNNQQLYKPSCPCQKSCSCNKEHYTQLRK